jgi:hypothetical protein
VSDFRNCSWADTFGFPAAAISALALAMSAVYFDQAGA